ncbi:Cytochrome c biogenesis protein CycY [Hartmannibacter diazotrophicus]|uniref:Cytochrome c biogenesis protein CycY n=1 Tax=Hartmannibacter diazotrophicus TaxID=1482074 RepID=A0A2C9DDI1_9HYPH|nr:DsbE family thiol:disulfide interchange protein [Hartmannibacter diazotrophicus]SON57675.1 Cytochrome c biogenesis protein CycY [Hartmannibacter diazotrophicus]
MSGPETAGESAKKSGGIKWIAFLPLLIFLGLAGFFLKQLFSGDPSELPSVLIGKEVPKFELPAVAGLASNGQPTPGLSSSELETAKYGDVVLLNVWASWCVPCRDEHPLLMELAKQPGFTLVGINYKDKPQNAADFLNGLGNPFKAVGSDESGRTGIDFGVYGVPETFVIDGTGHIRYKYIGPLSPEGIRDRLLPEIEKARTPEKAGTS